MAKRTYYTIISIITAAIIIFFAVFLTQAKITNKELRVSLIVKSRQTNFEFWQTVQKGAKEAAKEFHVDLFIDGPPNEEDTQGQIDIVKREMEKKPDVIILAAVDQDALVPYAKEIKARGIELVLVDSALTEPIERCFVGTDNIAAAKHVGEKMSEALGGKGKVIGITHQMTTTTAIERVKGFETAFDKYPDIEVVERQDVGDSVEKSKEITLELLEKYPDADGIFATNQISAEGVTAALMESGRAGEIVYFAIDSSTVQNEAMEQGVIDGFAIQMPFNMGYSAVKTAVEIKNNTLRETNIDTGFEFATKENMYEEEIQKLIYPFL